MDNLVESKDGQNSDKLMKQRQKEMRQLYHMARLMYEISVEDQNVVDDSYLYNPETDSVRIDHLFGPLDNDSNEKFHSSIFATVADNGDLVLRRVFESGISDSSKRGEENPVFEQGQRTEKITISLEGLQQDYYEFESLSNKYDEDDELQTKRDDLQRVYLSEVVEAPWELISQFHFNTNGEFNRFLMDRYDDLSDDQKMMVRDFLLDEIGIKVDTVGFRSSKVERSAKADIRFPEFVDDYETPFYLYISFSESKRDVADDGVNAIRAYGEIELEGEVFDNYDDASQEVDNLRREVIGEREDKEQFIDEKLKSLIDGGDKSISGYVVRISIDKDDSNYVRYHATHIHNEEGKVTRNEYSQDDIPSYKVIAVLMGLII